MRSNVTLRDVVSESCMTRSHQVTNASFIVFDSGEQQHSRDGLRFLATPQAQRSGLTIQIFAPDQTPADTSGVNQFAALVEQSLQDKLLPADTRRDHIHGSYLMVNETHNR